MINKIQPLNGICMHHFFGIKSTLVFKIITGVCLYFLFSYSVLAKDCIRYTGMERNPDGTYTLVGEFYECGGGSDGWGGYGWWYSDNATENARALHGGGDGGFSSDSLSYSMEEGNADDNCTAGNPIIISSGNKVQYEVDYVGGGEFPLQINKTYNHFANRGGVFGEMWRSDFDYLLTYTDTATCELDREGLPTLGCEEDFPAQPNSNDILTLIKPDGEKRVFEPSGKLYEWQDNDLAEAAKIVYTLGKFTLYEFDGMVEEYNDDGQILSRTAPTGIKHYYSYTNGKLASVSHTNGTSLTLSWVGSQVSQVTDSAGNNYLYEYSNGLLSKQTLPDGNYKEFSYGVTNYPKALTRIDVNGAAYARFTYDTSTGKALTSAHGSKGDIEKYTFAYTSNKTTLTNPLGLTTEFNYTTVNGKKRLSSVSRNEATFCSAANQTYTYDANGFQDKVTDWNGNETDYDYSDNGQLTSKTTAANTEYGVTTTYTWNSTFKHLLDKTETLYLRTEYKYDDNQRLIQIKKTNLTINGVPHQERITTVEYALHANDIVATKTVTDPLGNNFISHYNDKGNMTSTVDAIGNSTTFGAYDANGNVTSYIAPNGLITSFTYSVNNQLRSVKQGSRPATTYTYNALGEIDKVVTPDGSYIDKSFDEGYRVSSQVDNLGNKKAFTHDAMSNIKTTTFQKDTVVHYIGNVKYDELGRVRLTKGQNSQSQTITYYDDGNIQDITDALNNRTSFTYDVHGRIKTSTDAVGAVTTYDYNSQGLVTSVKDDNGHETTYLYDGFGQLVSQTSPDTGTTTFTYDLGGNLTSKTDASGDITRYQYDALNRQTLVVAGFSMKQFIYDNTDTTDKGRLTGVADNSGCTTYDYNGYGELITQNSHINGKTYTTDYNQDSYGRLKDITYPSGNKVIYGYNTIGKINSVKVKIGSTTKNVATNIAYKPFGPVTGWVYGNGLVRSMSYDLDYRLTDRGFAPIPSKLTLV